MKVVVWLFLSAVLLFGDVAFENNNSGIINIRKANTPTDKEQTRLNSIATQKNQPISGVTIKVLEVNISKDSSIKVEYCPELKQGNTIDNKKETTIKYQYKF